MQQYGIPGAVNYGHVNKMFAKFPSSLKVAFIEFKDPVAVRSDAFMNDFMVIAGSKR